MAFVYQSKRDFNFSKHENLSLGPGAYIGHRELKFPKSEIPFQTTSIRDTTLKTSPIPGPGSYNNNKPSIKPDQFGRIRCSSSFASLQDRFAQNSNELNPGPGSYSIKSNFNFTKRSRSTKSRNKILKTFPSVPSIPTQIHAFGYDETENGELVCQKNPVAVYSGIGQNSVGPGQYNPQTVSEIYNNKGTAWHKSSVKRDLSTKGSSNLGPGSYSDLRPGNWYKLKGSAAFASTCKRESYIPLGDDDERFVHDGNPGPGNYFLSNEKSVKSEKDFQKFGSGSKRFKSEKDSVPGPGQYKTEKKIVVNENKAPFASTDPRFTEKTNKIPGPGSYANQNYEEAMKKKTHTKKPDAFGCTEKRFQDKHSHGIPGPGEYDTKLQIGIHNTAKQRPSAVFESGVERIKHNEGYEGPAPGTYNIPSTFSSQKKKLPQGFSVWEKHEVKKDYSEDQRKDSANQIKNLKKEDRMIQKYVEFDQEDKKTKDVNGPGPGAYFKKSLRFGADNKTSTVSKVDRFTKKSSQNPGPGEYSDGNNWWNKKTFNIKFTDFK